MKLIKPVMAHGVQITELNFREPTGDDLASAGFPIKSESTLTGSMLNVIDAAAVSALMSRLGGVPTSTIKMLGALDWTRGMGEVMGFFRDMEAQGSA